MKRFYSILAMMVLCITSTMAVTITKTQGWFESGCVQWAWEQGATYTVYIRPEGGTYTQIDKELVRQYPGYGRADMVGLKAGEYQFKVVSSASGEAESDVFTATAHDRNGFAHYNRTDGVGAYNNNGTLKDNARVLYLTANNAKTVSLEMQVDSKGKMETRTGIQNIIQAYEKGQEKRPLAVRIIGTVKAADMDDFGSSAEGLQVKGNGSGKCNAQLTIEGIGDDATIHGFGILCRSISSVEFRNFAIMICLDDCLSLDTDNKNIWIHNMDFFYGGTGGDADQAKGDGTVDIKGKSSHVTVAYNHFFDSGKSSLGGMKSETTDCWMTYHHNWFDHSDSRHPRIRTAFYHVVNNYFDGNAKYGIGCTSGGSAFVESNYFRNCKYPMLISKQGTDAEGDGTFSGEPGGVIKAFNNTILNPKQVLYYDGKQTDGKWDAVKVESREAEVNAVAFSGGTAFNNKATAEAIKAVPASAIDNPANVPAIVRGELGAGRMNHGDFKWAFNNTIQDPNYGVITELKNTLLAYKSTLIGFADGTAIKNGCATETVNDGDGKGIPQEVNDMAVPSWGAGGDVPEEEDFEEEAFIADATGEDMFWVGENAAQTEDYIAKGIITLVDGPAIDGTVAKSSFNKTYAGNDTYVAEHIGSLQLGKSTAAKNYNGGAAIFHCPNGVTSFKVNILRTGTIHLKVFKSTDGVNYTEVTKVEDQKAGIVTKDFSAAIRNLESKDPVWVKIVNGATGGLNIHGVYICQLPAGAATLQDNDIKATVTEKELNIGETFKVGYTSTSTAAVSYSSSNPTVANVDAQGNVVTLTEGSATITIAQAKNETFKAGIAKVAIIVKDPRKASTFDVTSDASVSIKEGETSGIRVVNAAGTVAYISSNTAVATVSEFGIISAVAPGTAIITVTDGGTSTVKGATKTVNVTVTKDMTGTEICYFTASTKTPSNSMVTVSGNYSNGKGTVTYNGVNYKDCVKMESATSIKIAPTGDCKITLVFGGAAKNFYLDGSKIVTSANGQYTFDASAGKTYEVKKADSINLFLVVFEAKSTAANNIAASAIKANIKKFMKGRKVVIVNGTKKYNSAGAEVE